MESTAHSGSGEGKVWKRGPRRARESGSVQACCDPGLRCCDPITTNLYSAGRKRAYSRKRPSWPRSAAAIPTALIDLRARRDGARSRLRRRHRRAALRAARRPDRQSLRPGHDRRDAGAGARKPAPGGRRRTSSSSRARSKTFPCPTTPSTSSSPTASSISPPTRTASCAKRSAC